MDGAFWRRFLFAASIVLFSAAAHAGSNSMLAVSSDGKLLATANRDNGSVSIVDLTNRTAAREIPVGLHPESVAFLGDSKTVAVTVYGDDVVKLLDAETGKVERTIDVPDEPYGLAAADDGKRLYITCEYPGQVLEYDVEQKKILRTIDAGSMLRGIALSEPQQRLYVTEYLTTTVIAVSLETGEVVDRWPGTASENLARQIVVHPRRTKAYVPHIRSRTTVDKGEGAIVPFVTVVDTEGGRGRRRKPIAMDGLHSVFVVANPWEVALSPDATLLAAVFAGTDDVFLCRVQDDDYRELAYERVLKVGHNPRACAILTGRPGTLHLQHAGLRGGCLRRRYLAADGDDHRLRQSVVAGSSARKNPVLFGVAADGRSALDFVRELSSRRRFRRPHLAQCRGAAEHDVAGRHGVDAPDSLVGGPR